MRTISKQSGEVANIHDRASHGFVLIHFLAQLNNKSHLPPGVNVEIFPDGFKN